MMDNDFTKCTGFECLKKDSCYRYTKPPEDLDYYADFIFEVKNNVCPYRIEVEE